MAISSIKCQGEHAYIHINMCLCRQMHTQAESILSQEYQVTLHLFGFFNPAATVQDWILVWFCVWVFFFWEGPLFWPVWPTFLLRIVRGRFNCCSYINKQNQLTYCSSVYKNTGYVYMNTQLFSCWRSS